MGRIREGVPGLIQPRPASAAGSVAHVLLHCLGPGSVLGQLLNANTGLATGCRQRLRNRKATKGKVRKRPPWGLCPFDSTSCLIPHFCTFEIPPPPSPVFRSLIP